MSNMQKRLSFKNVVKTFNFYFEGWECRLNFQTGENYFPKHILLSEAGHMNDSGYIFQRAEIEERNKSISRAKKAARLYAKGLKKIFKSCMKPDTLEQMASTYLKKELDDAEQRWNKLIEGFTRDQIIKIGEGNSFKVTSYIDGSFAGEIIK